MKIGTRSVLFGVHQFLIHPWFVAWAWWRLYGFPLDPRLWVAFFIHDLGYVGKPNMDGPEGERHVEFGAAIMHALFDWTRAEYFRMSLDADPRKAEAEADRIHAWIRENDGDLLLVTRHAAHVRRWVRPNRWRDFCLYHSRFYANRDGKPFSRLCVADKLAITLEPWWLYLPRAILTGEIREYMALAKARNLAGEPSGKYRSMDLATGSRREWHRTMVGYVAQWVQEHRDGREDTWTPKGNAEAVAS